MNVPTTVLCIPGYWKDRSEIVTAIVANNENYIFAGQVLLNTKTKESYELEIYERDERMQNAFKITGRVTGVSDSFLDEIGKHNLVVYLIGSTGSLESAKAIALAGNAVLKAGGIGIKIESTGKAFTKEHWSRLLENPSDSDLYEMFVFDAIFDKNMIYSCGMHNIGLKDTIVYDENPEDATKLISIFNYYQLLEKPTISNNQTFGIDTKAPIFIITEEENQPYEGDDLYENPFGMWKLKRK